MRIQKRFASVFFILHSEFVTHERFKDNMNYSHLDMLESRSIHILRESYAAFKNLCMLWSIGKDSTVLLCLARKAFFGHVPFPLVHVDTHYKIPEMIEYRDRLAMEWNLDMDLFRTILKRYAEKGSGRWGGTEFQTAR
jgi:3'-phosphoadenosine 5'-phosphosulfate sulfotransferase (PAPS reductase)/FAD synthetase